MLLVVEVFDDLHKQVDSFLQAYASNILRMKRLKCLTFFFILTTFFRQ
jgi:hypothetical protein